MIANARHVINAFPSQKVFHTVGLPTASLLHEAACPLFCLFLSSGCGVHGLSKQALDTIVQPPMPFHAGVITNLVTMADSHFNEEKQTNLKGGFSPSQFNSRFLRKELFAISTLQNKRKGLLPV